MVICPDCGKEVPKNKFCKNCGAYLANVEETPVVEDVPLEIQSEEVIEETPVIEDAPVEIQSEDIIEVTPVVEDVPVEIQSEENIEADPEPGDAQSGNKFRFCYNCGYKLTGNFSFCPNCGQDLSGQMASSNNNHNVVVKKKSTVLAIILSVLLPGLGQIYLGLDRKGSLFLIGYVISAILILLIIGFLLVAVLWIWALVDTIISANAINRGEEVEDKLFK